MKRRNDFVSIYFVSRHAEGMGQLTAQKYLMTGRGKCATVYMHPAERSWPNIFIYMYIFIFLSEFKQLATATSFFCDCLKLPGSLLPAVNDKSIQLLFHYLIRSLT